MYYVPVEKPTVNISLVGSVQWCDPGVLVCIVGRSLSLDSLYRSRRRVVCSVRSRPVICLQTHVKPTFTIDFHQ